MRLSQATDYALRTVLHLATLKPGEVVTAETLAVSEKIPLRFLLKIARQLVAAGIVRSQRGAAGGYVLARDPREITLLDVVEAVEGPVRMNRCLIDQEYCSKRWSNRCPVHRALAGVQDVLVRELGRYNFADLARKAGGREEGGDNTRSSSTDVNIPAFDLRKG